MGMLAGQLAYLANLNHLNVEYLNGQYCVPLFSGHVYIIKFVTSFVTVLKLTLPIDTWQLSNKVESLLTVIVNISKIYLG